MSTQNGVIETATGNLLRAAGKPYDFAIDGAFDAVTETIRTDVPVPAKRRYQTGETQIHNSDGPDTTPWILVAQPLRVLATAGVTAVGNPSTTDESDLIRFILSKNSFNAIGRRITLTAWGSVSNNPGAKTIRIRFGSTIVAFNDVTTAPKDKKWWFQVKVFMTAKGTQKSIGVGCVGSITQNPLLATPAEDETSDIVVKITGQPATDDADRITAEGFSMEIN